MTPPPAHPSPPHRTFLGWDRPLLHLLARHLLARAASSNPGIVDLTDTIIVLTGTRAGRRLTELLMQRGEPFTRDASPILPQPTGLLPPTITTIQGLWNLVASPPVSSPPLRVATPLEQRLAWTAALCAAPRELLADLVPSPPTPTDLPRWLALADFLAGTHSELAGNAIAFSDVPALASTITDFPDAARWHAAADIERLYLDALRRAGLIDPASHRERCLTRGVIRADRRVIVAGVTDMNRAAHRLLDSLGGICEIVVFAPDTLAHRFDHHGCVIPEQWAEAAIDIPDSQIHVVGGPAQQAIAALNAIDQWSIDQWTGRPARSNAGAIALSENEPRPFGSGPPTRLRSGLVSEENDGPGAKAQSIFPGETPGPLSLPIDIPHSLSADQVTIGVPDTEVADRLLLLGNRANDAPDHLNKHTPPLPALHLRSAAGTPILRTAPLRLLAAVTEFLQARTFESFATLIRHPDVERWLIARFPRKPHAPNVESWLTTLDTYQSQHLHWIIDGSWQTDDPPAREALEHLFTNLTTLLGPLYSSNEHQHTTQQSLSHWAEPIWAVLAAVYSETAAARYSKTKNPHDPHSLAACELLHETLSGLLSLPGSLIDDLSCTAPAAIRILCSTVASLAVPDEANQGSIELLGWLELPLDDAPVMVITGLNEGVVPGPDGIDPLLPASLRNMLGLPSPRHRFARDAWSLSAILASRPSTTLICARRNSRGDPLSPSRLLLATDGETIAARVLRWASNDTQPPSLSTPVEVDVPIICDQQEMDQWTGRPARSSSVSIRPGETPGPLFLPQMPGAPTNIPIPTAVPVGFARRPIPVARPITTMSVTSFREYIDSPYGFYLKYVARLSELETRPVELDAMLFGNLLHEVLRKLQSTDAAASTNPDDIAEFLFASLTAVAHQSFGDEPMPAVWLQLRQARDRLLAFAQWQANWAAQGWRIYKAEWSPDKQVVSFDVDGTPMYLSGRIDRIDVNEATGQIAILDYKTGDKPPDITKLRSRGGDWRDLQLPLYRHLIRPLPFLNLTPDTLKLGYVAIARDPAKTGVTLADWTTKDLDSADFAAADVIRNIRLGNFSDLGNNPPQHGIFANICGTSYRSLTDQDNDPDAAIDNDDDSEDAA